MDSLKGGYVIPLVLFCAFVLIIGVIAGGAIGIILKARELVIKPIFGWDKYNEWPWEKIMIKRRKEGRHGRQGGVRQGD